MEIKGDMSFILLSLNEEMANKLEYFKHTNDLDSIKSKTNYLLSRYYDKLFSLSCSYIKIYNLFNTIKMGYIDKFDFNNKTIDYTSLKRESDIELVSILMRPSIEMYLELRSVEIAQNKGIDVEAIILLILQYSFFENYCNILENCKDFYKCQPLFYKRYKDETKTHYEQLKRTLSENDIPILKKINKKYLAIVNDDVVFEKKILGKDFYNLYSFISRKVHFSKFSYPISDQIDENLYLSWAVFFILYVYNSIFKIMQIDSEIIENLRQILDGIRSKGIQANSQMIFNVDDILILDFGIAKVLKDEIDVVHIQYIYANYLKPGDNDIVPKDFVRKKISIDILIDIEKKYGKNTSSINEFNIKLIDKKEYVNFWNDLYVS